MYTLLVLEDDAELNQTISNALRNEGYRVLTAFSCQEAKSLVMNQTFDLAVLDVSLPDGDGFRFCKWMKARCNVSVLFLSARDLEDDVLNGYESGADDYVTKPFGMMELVSRIKAVLRRSGKVEDRIDMELSGVRMDIKKHEVTVDGKQVALTLKEFELLETLMRNQGIVLTRDQLLADIWGYDFDGETRTVNVHIRTLRQKLGGKGEIIRTVRGVGYRVGGNA